MKNIHEVLRQKEADLQRVQKEIEALRIVLRLIADESDEAVVSAPRMAAVGDGSTAVSPVASIVQPGFASEAGYSAAWENAPSPRPFP
ncbi:MAG: hypothetical protein ACE14M_09020 [Terriglobales bacterium]